jgi:hypothetical protein
LSDKEVFVRIDLSIPGYEPVSGELERNPKEKATTEDIFRNAHMLLNELIMHSREHPSKENKE